jgi:hypothetical protein
MHRLSEAGWELSQVEWGQSPKSGQSLGLQNPEVGL